MGNHEFCTGCHESDFHYGRECDPVKKAKVDAEKAERVAQKAKVRVKLEEIREKLRKEGIKAVIEDDHLQIKWYDLDIK